MTTAKYWSWFAIVWAGACSNGGDADNGSRSDWVSCETSSDCGDGESCVEERCESPEEEPEPSASSAQEPEPNAPGKAEPEPDDEEPTPAASDEPEPNTADDDGEVGDSASDPEAVTGPNVLPDVGNEVSVDSGLHDAASESDAGTPEILDAGSVPTECGDANPCASYGPAQCMQLDNSATPGGCNSGWSCSQEIEIGAELEQRSGTVLVTCSSSGGTLYSCVCSGGSEDLSYSVMSSSSFSACSDISACAARLRL